MITNGEADGDVSPYQYDRSSRTSVTPPRPVIGGNWANPQSLVSQVGILTRLSDGCRLTIYLVLIRKAVSYWEIRTKEAFSSPGSIIVVW